MEQEKSGQVEADPQIGKINELKRRLTKIVDTGSSAGQARLKRFQELETEFYLTDIKDRKKQEVVTSELEHLVHSEQSDIAAVGKEVTDDFFLEISMVLRNLKALDKEEKERRLNKLTELQEKYFMFIDDVDSLAAVKAEAQKLIE